MYRSAPSVCVACEGIVDPSDADLTEDGLRCWRCSERVAVARLHEDLRLRVPRWQRELVRLAISGFSLASFVTAATMTIGYALADLVLVGAGLYALVRRRTHLGTVLVAVQCAIVAAVGGWIIGVCGMAFIVGRKALPLYPRSETETS